MKKEKKSLIKEKTFHYTKHSWLPILHTPHIHSIKLLYLGMAWVFVCNETAYHRVCMQKNDLVQSLTN